MPHTRVETVTVYLFDELDDQAKERAREWYREGVNNDFSDFGAFTLEDTAHIAELLGISLKTHSVTLLNKQTRSDPNIWYSGFGSQGDGACFEGRYAYQASSAQDIAAIAPADTVLNQIAQDLADLQNAHHRLLSATVRQTGRSCHAFSTTIDVVDGFESADDETAKDVADCLRRFMYWIYRQLETKYEYQLSDVAVDDNIRANEYEFDVNGKWI